MTEWNNNDYNNWIEKEQPLNIDVIKLYTQYSKIKSLDGIGKLPNLQILDCSYKPTGLQTFFNLIALNFYNNMLKSLEGIETLHNLEKLDCSNNLLQPVLF